MKAHRNSCIRHALYAAASAKDSDLLAFVFNVPLFTQMGSLRLAYPASTAPSKPLHPHIYFFLSFNPHSHAGSDNGSFCLPRRCRPGRFLRVGTLILDVFSADHAPCVELFVLAPALLSPLGNVIAEAILNPIQAAHRSPPFCLSFSGGRGGNRTPQPIG